MRLGFWEPKMFRNEVLVVKSEVSFSNKMHDGICEMKNSSALWMVCLGTCLWWTWVLVTGMLETIGKSPVPVAWSSPVLPKCCAGLTLTLASCAYCLGYKTGNLGWGMDKLRLGDWLWIRWLEILFSCAYVGNYRKYLLFAATP